MGKSRIIFRRMSRDDLAGARTLWTKSNGVELAEGDSPSDLTAYLKRNPGLSFVALSDNAVIGVVLAGHDGRRGFLYHLAVEEKHQRMGVGNKLVKLSLAELKKQKIRRVLVLVARDNVRGRNFWKTANFKAIPGADPLGLSF